MSLANRRSLLDGGRHHAARRSCLILTHSGQLSRCAARRFGRADGAARCACLPSRGCQQRRRRQPSRVDGAGSCSIPIRYPDQTRPCPGRRSMLAGLQAAQRPSSPVWWLRPRTHGAIVPIDEGSTWTSYELGGAFDPTTSSAHVVVGCTLTAISSLLCVNFRTVHRNGPPEQGPTWKNAGTTIMPGPWHHTSNRKVRVPAGKSTCPRPRDPVPVTGERTTVVWLNPPFRFRSHVGALSTDDAVG
jgi:hypothetical protein